MENICRTGDTECGVGADRERVRCCSPCEHLDLNLPYPLENLIEPIIRRMQ